MGLSHQGSYVAELWVVGFEGAVGGREVHCDREQHKLHTEKGRGGVVGSHTG